MADYKKVKIVDHDTGQVINEVLCKDEQARSDLLKKANIASPSFTGTPTIANPDAWLTALGLADSGWQTYTNSSAFTGTIYYRKIGKIVSIAAAEITTLTDFSSVYLELGILPIGYRPDYQSIWGTALPYGNSVPNGAVRIMTNGNILLYRLSNPTWYSTTRTDFHLTYFTS